MNVSNTKLIAPQVSPYHGMDHKSYRTQKNQHGFPSGLSCLDVIPVVQERWSSVSSCIGC